MAKGRKLTTSRSERLLGSFAYGHGQGAGADSSELGEEDVWSMVDDMVERDDHVGGLSLSLSLSLSQILLHISGNFFTKTKFKNNI
ncbi:unnamed protein product, partial [Vitis vinifera]